jgi:hypothetical protein
VQLLNSQLDTSFLTEIFPEVSFSFFQSNDSQRFISCFVARFADNDKCAECWRRITNRIAVDFQEELSNSFASWNIYLALVTPHQVDRHLKYRIENDRFALRKLMFSGREYFEGSDGPILSILEDSILGKDLELGVAHGSALPDEGSNFVREYLANVPPVPSKK